MSLNTSHLNGGVLIHNGEIILVFSDHTSWDFHGQNATAFKGTHHGRIYLTTHRVIFISNNRNDEMQSFSMPFMALHDVELEQPIFGANYIVGTVRAQPNGNWTGEVKFKCIFKHGGAVDFGQAMIEAARLATRLNGIPANMPYDLPPPPPHNEWYQAPPPAYAPPPQGYYGWMPPTHAFPDQPPANSVFMTDAPPPYPGINEPRGRFGGAAAGGGPASNAADAKAAEAAQAAYYDPNYPQMAFVPPPPSYEDAARERNN